MMVGGSGSSDSLTGPVYDLTTNDHGVAENGPYLIMGDGSTNHPFEAYLADVNDDGTIGDVATAPDTGFTDGGAPPSLSDLSLSPIGHFDAGTFTAHEDDDGDDGGSGSSDSLTGPVYDLTTNDHGVAENGPYLIMGDGSTNHPFEAYLADVNDDGTIGDVATAPDTGFTDGGAPPSLSDLSLSPIGHFSNGTYTEASGSSSGSAIQGNFTMNTSVVDANEIQITLNLEQDQTVTAEMLSELKVNDSSLNFGSGGNAVLTMGGTTGDTKAFINVTGLDTNAEIKVTFGQAMNTINSMSDGFTFSGQLGTDYDYNNETLKVEFVFNTQDLGGNPITVPTESEIKSELKVNGQALDFTSGTPNAVYEELSATEVKVTVTGLSNTQIHTTTVGQATLIDNASNVFDIGAGGLYTNSPEGYYAMVQIAGISSHGNDLDNMYSVVRVEAGSSSSGWVRSSDQSGITGSSLESISYADLGQIIANESGYIYPQMPGHSYTGYTFITSKLPEGYEIYADEISAVLHVLLKDQDYQYVPIANSDGDTFSSPGEIPSDVSDWYTLDDNGNAVAVTLDEVEEVNQVVDRTPNWSGELTVIDGKSIYQDDNTDSPSSTYLGTDITLDTGSVIKVVITDSIGTAFTNSSDLPTDSSQWYTENPDNLGQFIPIDFGDENVVFSYPIDDMVQQLNGIYNGYDLDGDGSPVNELENFPGALDSLKAEIVTAVIDGAGSGDGSIPGIETLTGLDADV